MLHPRPSCAGLQGPGASSLMSLLTRFDDVHKLLGVSAVKLRFTTCQDLQNQSLASLNEMARQQVQFGSSNLASFDSACADEGRLVPTWNSMAALS